MIKANELRIGNWVVYGHTTHRKVTAIVSTIIPEKVGLDGLINNIDLIEPIPLTPEILEKCGFEKQQDFFSKRIDEYVWLHIYLTGLYGFWSDSKENENNFTVISQDNSVEHLHQIQNLYFSLTGQELEYKK